MIKLKEGIHNPQLSLDITIFLSVTDKKKKDGKASKNTEKLTYW